MSEEQSNFDARASIWDDNPIRVKLADDVAVAIIDECRPSSEMDVLDFGCGTGLLTLRIQPLIRSIVGVDSSRGMLDVFKNKIQTMRLTNASAQLLEVDNGETLLGVHDLVVSNMTLHHVRDLSMLFSRFFEILRPGGRICVADIDLDGGEFHENADGVFHYGFDRDELKKTIADAGFVDIRFRLATEVEKQARSGGMRAFTVFIVAARRPF
jgi:2-polyprenyl-3-methyl-5-hydroxy-6-metoxy-1,4-benzoquinol methylase